MNEVKKTSPAESLPRMREAIAAGRGFWITVTGRSMAPFLEPIDDRVFIAPLSSPVRVGDVVLAECPGGKLVLHRVCRITPDGFYLNGDAQNYTEGPFANSSIIGIMTEVIGKNGKHRHIGAFRRFGGRLWLLTRKLRPAMHELGVRKKR